MWSGCTDNWNVVSFWLLMWRLNDVGAMCDVGIELEWTKNQLCQKEICKGPLLWNGICKCECDIWGWVYLECVKESLDFITIGFNRKFTFYLLESRVGEAMPSIRMMSSTWDARERYAHRQKKTQPI